MRATSRLPVAKNVRCLQASHDSFLRPGRLLEKRAMPSSIVRFGGAAIQSQCLKPQAANRKQQTTKSESNRRPPICLKDPTQCGDERRQRGTQQTLSIISIVYLVFCCNSPITARRFTKFDDRRETGVRATMAPTRREGRAKGPCASAVVSPRATLANRRIP